MGISSHKTFPLLGRLRNLRPLEYTHAGRTKKREKQNLFFSLICDFAGIQTRNLLIRSQMLYSVELRSHISELRVQR